MHVPSDDTRVGAVEGWVDRVHHAKGGIDETNKGGAGNARYAMHGSIHTMVHTT